MVTTVIPVWERAALLREAVASVLNQTYRPIEIIIVDDGSTDDTGLVCDELAASHPDLHVIHQCNRGPGAAREAGRLVARGEFLQFLDSDDLLLPRKFECQIAALRKRLDAGVAYGPTRWRNPDGSLAPGFSKRSGDVFDSLFPGILAARPWDTPTPLYRAAVVDAAGGWSDLRHEEDWEMDCRVAAIGTRPAFVNEIVAEVRRFYTGHTSGDGARNRSVLRDRAAARERIFATARQAGIGPEIPEMQRFARELFLFSRQCGAVGLSNESRDMFILAREAGGRQRGRRWDFRAYRGAAAVCGWTAVGKLACWIDRLRKRRDHSADGRDQSSVMHG